MFRTHSTLFGFLAAAAALGIAGIASAWSWNPAIYAFGPMIVLVLAARIFAGYSPLSYGRKEKEMDRDADAAGDDGLERYPDSLRPGMPASNNQLLASAYAQAQQEGMTGDAMERFAKVAARVDEDERGDRQS